MAQPGLAASPDATGANRMPAEPTQLDRFRRLVLATLALTLALVAIGGAVRATDSGLACPDWPRCYGQWIPQADPNIWVEHTHRLVAGVVALLITALAVWALARFRDRRDLVVPALLGTVFVFAQAALGAVVIWRELDAEVVTAHLGMAMVVVACLVYLAVAATLPAGSGGRTPLALPAAAVAGLAYAQILVGGHVTGIGASLAFTDFPTMGGTMLPAIGDHREAFHVLHRALAFLLLGGVSWLAARALRLRREEQAAGRWHEGRSWLVKLPMWAATLILVQICLGVANLWLELSPFTVVPHLAVASWIWAVLVLHAVLAARLGGVAEEAR